MKIDRLHIEHFIGARAVDIDTAATVQLIAGRNGSGKSSIRDAVALALTADLGRVSLKKDAAQLITTGAAAAVCEITDADGDVYGVTITAAGKIADTHKGRENSQALPYVLDAQRFANLDPTGRRAFLFGLTGAAMGQAEVAQRLEAKGCNPAKVARIMPLMRSGFPAAADDAKAQATAAKGAWRAVTGETYGAVKAATWKAPAVAFDQSNLAAALQALAATDTGVAAAQNSIGSLESAARTVAEAKLKLVGLREVAANLVRRKVKLQHDEQALKDAQDLLDAATAKAGNTLRVGLVHDLARSVHALLELGAVGRDSVVGVDADQALAAYQDAHGSMNSAIGDTESRAKLPGLTGARDLLAGAVRNSMRDVKASEDAAAQTTLLEQQIAAIKADAAELAAGHKHLANLQSERKTRAGAVDLLRAAKAAAEGAAKKTTDAGKHHADVDAWDKIASALAPDGIPAEILAGALDPINARLAQSALDAQWDRVEITADMAIRTGLHERPYSMLSESEQYRADAMLAEAVAHISGERLLVLDRFDVLDLQGRADLIAWLDCLAENGEIDTALIFGTLKALPAILPATFGAHWIDNGVVAHQLKAAA